MYDPSKGYPRVVPYLLYRDAGAAVRWLSEVLELREVVRFKPDGGIGFAELERDGFTVQVGMRNEPTPAEYGNISSMTLVFVDDVDATCKRAPGQLEAQ